MWIATNKSFLSVVENSKNKNQFVVRARVDGDLEEFFGYDIDVIESADSDYRFRVFVDKAIFKHKMMDNINSIDYFNFKDSVKDFERKTWYMKIWHIMFQVQESLYESGKWWERYYNAKNFHQVHDGKDVDKF
jgi:hypothetical protein